MGLTHTSRETAASENATSYFPLLDRVANGHFSTAVNDEQLYSSFVDILREDGHISTPDALSTFNLALSLRTAAPRIEAHYQHYLNSVEPSLDTDEANDCSSWILLNGDQYCDPLMKEPTKKSVLPRFVSSLSITAHQADDSSKDA